MEQISKIPLVGGIIAAIVLYFEVLWGFIRSPIKFVPDFCKKKETGITKVIEILFASLVVSYLILVPVLETTGAFAAQPVFLFFMMLRYLILIPAMHFGFKVFGSNTLFKESVVFLIMYIAIFLPLCIILQYPMIIAVGGNGFLYGLSNSKETWAALMEFNANDTRAPLFNSLFLIGQAINLSFFIICLFWLKRIYDISRWRVFGGVCVGLLSGITLDHFMTQPAWKSIEPYILYLAKIA